MPCLLIWGRLPKLGLGSVHDFRCPLSCLANAISDSSRAHWPKSPKRDSPGNCIWPGNCRSWRKAAQDPSPSCEPAASPLKVRTNFHMRAAFERELIGYITAWGVGEEARERCHFRSGGDGGVGFLVNSII